MFNFSAFASRSRAGGGAWFRVGPASSFPDITDDARLREPRNSADESAKAPGCKVYHVPKEDSTRAFEIVLDDAQDPEESQNLKDQVMVFKYKEKFFAINHECPHSSYPLSQGTPFDIEDFGVVLSSGISCPKHGWSFDLNTGSADRGNYKLQVWEVELRANSEKKIHGLGSTENVDVWVRRKQRIG